MKPHNLNLSPIGYFPKINYCITNVYMYIVICKIHTVNLGSNFFAYTGTHCDVNLPTKSSRTILMADNMNIMRMLFTKKKKNPSKRDPRLSKLKLLYSVLTSILFLRFFFFFFFFLSLLLKEKKNNYSRMHQRLMV